MAYNFTNQMMKRIAYGVAVLVIWGHLSLAAQNGGFGQIYFFNNKSTALKTVIPWDEDLLVIGQYGNANEPRSFFVMKVDTFGTILDLEDDIAARETQLAGITPYSAQWFAVRHQIAVRERCLQQAKNKLIFLKGTAREYAPLIAGFQNDLFLYRTYVYGMMVHNEDYQDARSYLGMIGACGEEQMDFVTIQQINLDRLEDFTYTPQETVLNTIETIGLKIFPMSGYARSLYRYFTGERLELELPYTEDDPEVQPRASIAQMKPEFRVWPNPARGRITIEAPVPMDAMILLYDLQGRNVHVQNVSMTDSEITSVDVSTIPGGIYILTIDDLSGVTTKYSTKIVIIH